MMWNKHYGSMYCGSMIGSGALVFAVMGYVIANQVPDAEVGSQVELNPKLLSFILGETEDDVASAIDFLCKPDPKSRTPECDGKRLVKLGEYAYQVVNGAKYAKLKNEDDRRRQNREAKRRERARKPKSKPSPGESAYVRTLENEGQEAADAQMERSETINGEALARAMIRQEDKMIAEQIVEAAVGAPEKTLSAAAKAALERYNREREAQRQATQP